MHPIQRAYGILLCVSLLAATRALLGANAVTVWVEKAPTANGPWIRLDLGGAAVDPDGNPRITMTSSNEFFRTRVEVGPSFGPGDKIPLLDVPQVLRAKAVEMLGRRSRLTSDAEGWPEGAQLATEVLPIPSPGGDPSKPAMFEFKVLKPREGVLPGPLPTHPETYVQLDAGYLLISANSDDFPVAEFATEGPTLSETLARAAKTSRIRVIRYGPGLAVAEDEKGGILASLGSVPFKLDTNIFKLDGLEWFGNSTNGTDVSPREVPNLKVEPYADYAAFKKDFLENKVYEDLRRIKRARAKLEWDLLNGTLPTGVTVQQRQSVRVLNDLPLVPTPEVLLTSETDGLARVSVSSTGGIIITGLAPGHGLLRARSGNQERVIAIRVTPAIGKLSPQIVDSGTWYAGDWSMQLKYHQFEDADWCPVVGCGPVAWAMLLGWFDRHWGAEYAFNGEGSGSAPPMDTASSNNRSKARPIYRELHEQCDVICVGGQGATYPTDMTEGFKGYTWIYALSEQIGRKWRINAITGTWPDAGALRCRDAIKDGYPAVVGLGFLWHYALAYGYAYEVYDIGGGYTVTKRYLKCNMGWGPNVSPRWYNLGDTFYAADVQVWRGPKG